MFRAAIGPRLKERQESWKCSFLTEFYWVFLFIYFSISISKSINWKRNPESHFWLIHFLFYLIFFLLLMSVAPFPFCLFVCLFSPNYERKCENANRKLWFLYQKKWLPRKSNPLKTIYLKKTKQKKNSVNVSGFRIDFGLISFSFFFWRVHFFFISPTTVVERRRRLRRQKKRRRKQSGRRAKRTKKKKRSESQRSR